MNPPAEAVVRRIFDMVLQGKSILDVTKTLNAEGIPTTNGKKWLKTTILSMAAGCWTIGVSKFRENVRLNVQHKCHWVMPR